MVVDGGVVGLIVLVLDIWAILTIVAGGDPASVKALWIVLILLLPLIGLLIWLLAGPRTRALTG